MTVPSRSGSRSFSQILGKLPASAHAGASSPRLPPPSPDRRAASQDGPGKGRLRPRRADRISGQYRTAMCVALRIVQLGIPVGAAPVGRAVEKVPQRVNEVVVAGVLAGGGRGLREAFAPEEGGPVVPR